MIGSMLLVLGVELLNSAIEAVIERYGPEHHELAGRAKDMGSAAVFVMMMNVLLCWGLILAPRWTCSGRDRPPSGNYSYRRCRNSVDEFGTDERGVRNEGGSSVMYWWGPYSEKNKK